MLLELLHDGEITPDYIEALLERVCAAYCLPAHRYEWAYVQARFAEFASECDKSCLLALFYMVLAHESSLQEHVAGTLEGEPARLRFFREEFLPYVVRMTELLRSECFVYPNTELQRYADGLREAWVLQCVRPLSAKELLDIRPISLVRTTQHPLPNEEED